VLGDPVKKLENQLRLGLEPMIGDEPSGEAGEASAANFCTLFLFDIEIGDEGEPPC
jgi:hypothetical protein